MRSDADTVQAYLEELSPERRETVSTVRDWVRSAIPDGYREGMNFGMICWEIPLEHYPDTYNGKPLGAVALASQKHHCSLYLHGPYMDPELTAAIERGFEAAGKRLDMGKSCIRFKRAEDLPRETVEEAVAALDPDAFIALYEAARSRSRRT